MTSSQTDVLLFFSIIIDIKIVEKNNYYLIQYLLTWNFAWLKKKAWLAIRKILIKISRIIME